jgi:hypothetical protein
LLDQEAFILQSLPCSRRALPGGCCATAFSPGAVIEILAVLRRR